MLEFTRIDGNAAPILEKYYGPCTYRLCEYSVGVKLMWREHGTPEYAEAHDCLIVLYHSKQGILFDFPVPLPGTGDVEAALDDIEAWCLEHEVSPAFGVVPAAQREALLRRYPCVLSETFRSWQDYIYAIDDLASFAGRRYSAQRNHVNKFRRLYPQAEYKVLTEADVPALEDFCKRYREERRKNSPDAREELELACAMMPFVGAEWVRGGALVVDGRIAAVSLAEVCGDTLICHIEKAFTQYEGVYAAMVQSFAAANRQEGIRWINREDDAGDPGLRISKLQYEPSAMDSKYRISARNELWYLEEQPTLSTERLTLTPMRDEDREPYYRLCTDDYRNRMWGYDYRKDLKGPLTEDYFLEVTRQDYAARQALNLAIRLGDTFIGELVFYRFDCRGSAELGCRILPEYSGHGYGMEAYQRAAAWGLYGLGLACLKGRCHRENRSSYRMLSSAMRLVGEDEDFFYFEKRV